MPTKTKQRKNLKRSTANEIEYYYAAIHWKQYKEQNSQTLNEPVFLLSLESINIKQVKW